MNKISNKKVLIGNLPTNANEDELRALFASRSEQVVSVTLPLDSRGRVAGHAFVEMVSREVAVDTVEELRGVQLNGRTLNISLTEQPQEKAKEKKKSWFAFWNAGT